MGGPGVSQFMTMKMWQIPIHRNRDCIYIMHDWTPDVGNHSQSGAYCNNTFHDLDLDEALRGKV